MILSYFPLGACYYLSSTVNPFLYSLLSVRFRRGFQDVLRTFCGNGSTSGAGNPSQANGSQQGQLRPGFRYNATANHPGHHVMLAKDEDGGVAGDTNSSRQLANSGCRRKYKLLYVSSLKQRDNHGFLDNDYELAKSCPPNPFGHAQQARWTSSEDSSPSQSLTSRTTQKKTRQLRRCRRTEELELHDFG